MKLISGKCKCINNPLEIISTHFDSGARQRCMIGIRDLVEKCTILPAAPVQT